MLLNDKLFNMVVLEREQAHYLAAFHYNVRDDQPDMAMYNQFEYLRLEDELNDIWHNYTEDDWNLLPYVDSILILGNIKQKTTEK